MKRTSIALVIALVVCLAFPNPVLFADQATPPQKKTVALPLILNIFPGLGLGSFIQGDPLGGFIGLGGEVLGVGLMTTGVVWGMVAVGGVVLTEIWTGGQANSSLDPGAAAAISALVISGSVIWTGTRIFEIIRPITFAGRYNREHGLSSLRLTPSFKVAAASPAFFEPGLMATLSY